MNGHMRFIYDVVVVYHHRFGHFGRVALCIRQLHFWLPFRSNKLPRIVMLHQVTPHAQASGMNMPPEKFEQLLQLLVKKCGILLCI